MEQSALTEQDRRRIVAYREKLGQYERPCMTADIVALRPVFEEPGRDRWRENPKFCVELLLIRRGQWPHEGCWALPGGFVNPNESVEEGARRELLEETDLEARPLIPVGVFSKPGRDMRAWIISSAFVTVYRPGEGGRAKGCDDAAEAKWFRVDSPVVDRGRFVLSFRDGATPAFTLRGTYAPTEFDGGRVTSVEKNPLAFDHAEIIAAAFLRMLSFDVRKLAFSFLPEKFTLSRYIDVYQYLTRHSVDADNIPNFRRQLTATRKPLLVPCGDEREDLVGRGHAPARLYRRRKDS